ncbi:MAG: hypothetical protein U1E29_08035 [Coriobacteriia bacterium]|nr:hypothetical protein [Coriobacteriia bacterium]
MVYPTCLVFEDDLGPVGYNEEVRLAVYLEQSGSRPESTIRVFRRDGAAAIEVEFNLGSDGLRVEREDDWEAAVDRLRPDAEALADEVAVALWRPRTARVLDWSADLSTGSHLTPRWQLRDTRLDSPTAQPVDSSRVDTGLGKRSLHGSVAGLLLVDAVNARDPISQFVCLWQSLATTLNCDAPSRIDAFLQELSIPVAAPTVPKDRRETQFTRLRQRIAHPVDRAATFAAIHEDASILTPQFATLVLDVFRSGQASVEQGHRADGAR